MDSLEALWSDLLSGDVQRVRQVWDSLAADERAALRQHLAHMRDDSGWHPAQRAAAAAALEIIAAGAPPTD